jgi:hypothetical protein
MLRKDEGRENRNRVFHSVSMFHSVYKYVTLFLFPHVYPMR